SMARFRIPKKEPPYYEDSPRYSQSVTLFGGVAGASKVLQLNKEETANAFGIAGASTPVGAGMKWHHIDGPIHMTKYNCWSGWVASLAVMATLAAERGFTGDTTILDGERGFWQIFGSPFVKWDMILGELGKTWHLDTELVFKPYPTCRGNHTGIEAISNLVRQNGIKPDDIEAIVVKTDPILITPLREGLEVKSFADTQFRNAYIFAIAALHGSEPGPQWQLPSTYNDPKIRALMEKVKVEIHPNTDEMASAGAKAGKSSVFNNIIAEIYAGGRKFTAEVEIPRGNRSRALTEEELKEKFRNNAGYSSLKVSRCEEAIDMILNLEKVDDVCELLKGVNIET
ncbi:MmgE/PrpD family protein, partial [Chloroflexota bacterium]